jgi:flagellar biosynthesis protein FliR
LNAICDLLLANWPFVHALVRTAGFVALLPATGLGLQGFRARAIAAVILALVIASVDHASRPVPEASGMLAACVVEASAGLLLGFTLRALLSAIQIVSHAIELQLGVSGFTNPDDEEYYALGRLYQLTTLAVFFCLSGHRVVFAALLRSPDAGFATQGPAACGELAVQVVSSAWCLAVQAALPLIVSLVSTHVAVGIIARMLPQISVPLAAPVQILGGLALALLTIATVSGTFGHGAHRLLQLMSSAHVP